MSCVWDHPQVHSSQRPEPSTWNETPCDPDTGLMNRGRTFTDSHQRQMWTPRASRRVVSSAPATLLLRLLLLLAGAADAAPPLVGISPQGERDARSRAYLRTSSLHLLTESFPQMRRTSPRRWSPAGTALAPSRGAGSTTGTATAPMELMSQVSVLSLLDFSELDRGLRAELWRSGRFIPLLSDLVLVAII